MPATGVFGDLAGGPVRAAAQQWKRLEGKLVTVVTDKVIPHGQDAHSAAQMVQGSPWMFLMGKPACSTGDLASCGHALAGSMAFYDVDAGAGPGGEKNLAKHVICHLGKSFDIDPETRRRYLALLQHRRHR